jgi:hypothetical protein
MVARPVSAAPRRQPAGLGSTLSERPKSASYVRHDIATGLSSTVKRVPHDEPEDVEEYRARNKPYVSSASDSHGTALPQFRALSSGYLTYKERVLMEMERDPDAPPRKQPDRVRAWTSQVPDPPPTVSEVARGRGRPSEQLVDPLSLEGKDCRGVQFARVPLQDGEKPRLRPRRSDRMAAVLAAKAARDRMLARRLGQGEGHKEAEGRAYFKATHNPPGQPRVGLPREVLVRSREQSVWAREHPDVVQQRKAWEAKDKLLFEKNRLRKMITDKLTQENNDKKQLVAAR